MSDSTALQLTNQFLIAMPRMDDPNFLRSVTLICEHTDEGALGIVINRPTEISLGEMFEQLQVENVDPQLDAQQIFQGGPVHTERGFVLHDASDEYEASLKIADNLTLTSSRDILTAIADGFGPKNFLVALGYAGWGAGQLEQEMLNNSWLTVPADSQIIFHQPTEARWRAAASELGVDITQLSGISGHS